MRSNNSTQEPTRILLISHNDNFGGAARAVNRLRKCLNSEGTQAKLLVMQKYNDQKDIAEFGLVRKIIGQIYSKIDIRFCNYLDPGGSTWKTSAFFGAITARYINKFPADVVNFHWIGHGLISLRQLNKIKKPIIWTLQDDWALQPLNHFQVERRTTRRLGLTGGYIHAHLIRYISSLKRKFILKDNVILIALNSKMNSELLDKYPEKSAKIFVIANPVDLDIFAPDRRNFYADSLGLSVGKPTLLYLGGINDMRKGWDLLQKSLNFTHNSFNLIVIGGHTKKIISNNQEINILGLKKVLDLNNLIDLYNLSTAVIVPSRNEGLPQTATESLSCGTPVIGFRIGGLNDIIFDNYNGYLVQPFNTQKLGLAIDQTINLGKNFFKHNCRLFAEKEFAYRTIKSKYDSVFDLKFTQN